MLIGSLILSAVLLGITNLTARSSGGAWAAAGVAVLGGFASIGLMFFSPAYLLNAALLVMTGLILAACKSRPSAFLKASLAITVLCYGGFGIHSLLIIHDLRNHYSAVSLADRLVYEEAGRDPKSIERHILRPNSETVMTLESQIKTEQSNWQNGNRPLALKRLHEETVQQFVDSPGFGVGRLNSGGEYVKLPPIESIRQPSPPDDPSPIPPESRSAFPVDARPAPIEASRSKGMHLLHEQSLLSFVNAPGFGYVTGRQAVGFPEHHFRALPGKDEGGPDNLGTWQVQRVELVSLLKHPEPRVYVSDNLPRMDELRTAKTRELNDFESSRLSDLVKGEDLVSGRVGETVFVLGAIRAANQCVECHGVERGELLGVFSDRLRATDR